LVVRAQQYFAICMNLLNPRECLEEVFTEIFFTERSDFLWTKLIVVQESCNEILTLGGVL
jgi:hypothetical protein